MKNRVIRFIGVSRSFCNSGRMTKMSEGPWEVVGLIKTDNALATPLDLRVFMGSNDHLFYKVGQWGAGAGTGAGAARARAAGSGRRLGAVCLASPLHSFTLFAPFPLLPPF
ncbi:hypothetical protein EVAR_16253_1 [Eumeta japonica]|uniref:Uncharacterized protein n=1 Tax=Eumeta variegata TaxID=151549 RepID=A0A4C1U6X8_EUMVA|nr:hypothetical protein EVAR_16253_1 [Eumeta japonica]